MSTKSSRSNSVVSASRANRNLPEDPKTTATSHHLSPQQKEALARKGLAWGNFVGKGAGLITVVPHAVGEKCGFVAGIPLGLCAQGVHALFSSQPEDARKKKGEDVFMTVRDNTEALGGLVAGAPFLLAGAAVNVAVAAPVTGKLGAKWLTKHERDRPAYSWRLKDSLQRNPGCNKLHITAGGWASGKCMIQSDHNPGRILDMSLSGYEHVVTLPESSLTEWLKHVIV